MEVTPAIVRALNEKGGVIGEAYATPTANGYVTLRTPLAGAFRAEIIEGDRRQEVTVVHGDDVERNLVVVSTAIEPGRPVTAEVLTVTESAQWTVRCGPQEAIPVQELSVRDLPSFGLIYLGRTAHGDSISGCPAWDEAGRWRGIVVWESPLARPSVAMVPASYALQLAGQTAKTWAEWRSTQSTEGTRFRNSLLIESLQDIWRAQYVSALENLTLLLGKRPTDARAWYYRGYAKAMSGDRYGAIEDYEQAVTHDPLYVDAHFSLGFSYLLLKRKLEATEQAKELDRLDEEMAMKLRMLIEAMSEHPAGPLEVDEGTEDATPAPVPIPNPE